MDYSILSKHRQSLYGFAALWILLFHGYAIFELDFSFGFPSLSFINWSISMGNVGVDIFLFISGISLYYSYTKDSNIGRFFERRMLRLLPATLFSYGFYWFIRFVLIEGRTSYFLYRMTLLTPFIDGMSTGPWYVSASIVLYLLFPYIYHMLFRTTVFGSNSEYSLLTLVLMLFAWYLGIFIVHRYSAATINRLEFFVFRVPAFIIGIYFGRHVMNHKQLSILECIIFGIFLTGFVYTRFSIDINSTWYRRLLYPYGGIALSVLLSCAFDLTERVFDATGRILSYFGQYSLELYLCQLVFPALLRLVLPSFEYATCGIIPWIFIMVIAYLWAVAISKANGALAKGLLKSTTHDASGQHQL